MQDTIEVKPNGKHRESYIKYEADQKRIEKEPELFPTPKPAKIEYSYEDLENVLDDSLAQKTEKSFWEKVNDKLHWFLNSDDKKKSNLMTLTAMGSQAISHTVGFVAMMSKFRNTSTFISVPFGVFASVIFETYLHHLANKGAFWLPLGIAFISGIFSMYAWSGLLQSGLAGFIIGVGISFIPPFVILWDARNNYKDKKNKELEKEIEEAKQREALKIENEQREANGEKPKEIIKKKRARKITKEEKLVIVKAILDSNMNDFEKIKTKFDVGRSTAFTLLALASKIRARKQKEISANNAPVTDR
ncbi:MAG: DMT family transporter [Leptospiraceae bacterium]|nr:DMT family transporter [Leptospiraceae bacterium]